MGSLLFDSLRIRHLGPFLIIPTGIALLAAAGTGVSAQLLSTHKPAPADPNPTITAGAFSIPTTGGEIKEDEIRQALAGKSFYLRSGYLDNSLEFDEQGHLTNHSRQGSFTLSQIQISKVKLTKHKLELEGDRFALHFLGAAPYEDPTKATDRVKITPKKKTVRISFEREQVEKPKKDKATNKRKHRHDDQSSDEPAAPSEASASGITAQTAASSDHPSDDKRVTTSPAHASQLLLAALDNVFSPGVDDRMISSLPDFWKLYYQAAAAKHDYRPADPTILQLSAVDQKAKLISVLDPPSNEFAQANGIAGIALYHAVVGADGKVQEVIAARPIGFGLDENADESIRKATFQPAMKDGKPVAVALDLVVSFRIYSKRTSQPAAPESSGQPDEKTLPGPYTVQAMEQAHAQQAQPETQGSSQQPNPATNQNQPATTQNQPVQPQPAPAPTPQ